MSLLWVKVNADHPLQRLLLSRFCAVTSSQGQRSSVGIQFPEQQESNWILFAY